MKKRKKQMETFYGKMEVKISKTCPITERPINHSNTKYSISGINTERPSGRKR